MYGRACAVRFDSRISQRLKVKVHKINYIIQHLLIHQWCIVNCNYRIAALYLTVVDFLHDKSVTLL